MDRRMKQGCPTNHDHRSVVENGVGCLYRVSQPNQMYNTSFPRTGIRHSQNQVVYSYYFSLLQLRPCCMNEHCAEMVYVTQKQGQDCVGRKRGMGGFSGACYIA